MNKIGIFGGAFNPPHIAHCILAESVRQHLDLEKILIIPSGNPPLKNSIPEKHRYEMSLLAFGDNDYFEVSDIEIKNMDQRSYTVDTLEKLKKRYSNTRLFLIIGFDNLIDLPRWKEPERLFELSEVVVINRPDYDLKAAKTEFHDRSVFIRVPYLEISSTEIRRLVYEGKSIRYLVNKKVEDYINKNKLYR